MQFTFRTTFQRCLSTIAVLQDCFCFSSHIFKSSSLFWRRLAFYTLAPQYSIGQAKVDWRSSNQEDLELEFDRNFLEGSRHALYAQ
jgi:hypothetical protein